MAKSSMHGGHGGSGSAIHNDKERKFKKHNTSSKSYDYINDDWIKDNINLAFSPDKIMSVTEMDLDDVYRQAYEATYTQALIEQNKRNTAAGHAERNKSISDWLHDQKHGAREMMLQIGSDENPAKMKDGSSISRTDLGRILISCVDDLNSYLKDTLKEHYCPMYAALHMDELTPHIHFDYSIAEVDKSGTLKPGLNKGLEQAGIELPNPDRIEEVKAIMQQEENEKAQAEGRKPKKINLTNAKYNNRLVTFTEMMRTKWEDIVMDHGIDIQRSEHCDRTHEDQNRHRQKKLQEDIEQLEKKYRNIIDTMPTEGQIKEAQESLSKAQEELLNTSNDVEYLKAQKGALVDDILASTGNLKFVKLDLAKVNKEIQAKRCGGTYVDNGEIVDVPKEESASGIISAAREEAEKIRKTAKQEILDAKAEAKAEEKNNLLTDDTFRADVAADLRSEIKPMIEHEIRDEVRQRIVQELREEIRPDIEKEVREAVEAMSDGSSAEYKAIIAGGMDTPDIERHVRRSDDGALMLSNNHPEFLTVEYNTPSGKVPLRTKDYPIKQQMPFFQKIIKELMLMLKTISNRILGDAQIKADTIVNNAENKASALISDPQRAFEQRIDEKLGLVSLVEVEQKRLEAENFFTSQPLLAENGINADTTEKQLDQIEDKCREQHIDLYVKGHSKPFMTNPQIRQIRDDGRRDYNLSDESKILSKARSLITKYQELKQHPHSLEEIRMSLTSQKDTASRRF